MKYTAKNEMDAKNIVNVSLGLIESYKIDGTVVEINAKDEELVKALITWMTGYKPLVVAKNALNYGVFDSCGRFIKEIVAENITAARKAAKEINSYYFVKRHYTWDGGYQRR